MEGLISFVSDLHPFKSGWKLRVKILKIWYRGSPSGRWLDMLVCDEKGFRIHASVKPADVHIYEDVIKENEWRIFWWFAVTEQKMFGPRADDHPLKIEFMSHTTVLVTNPVSASLFLHPIRIFDIVDRAIHRDYLPDVIGVLRGVGELSQITLPRSGFVIPRLRFELINAERDIVLACTASGPLATEFHERYTSMKNDLIVCVLRFWMISDGRGSDEGSVVLKSIDISDFLFDPNDEDVDECRTKYLMK